MSSGSDFAKLIALSPKVTGSISLVCSALLINHVTRTPGQIQKVSNRILLGVAISDALYTFVTPFLSTWMVPPNVVDANGNMVEIYGAAGTQATCTAQGFLDNFSSKSSWMYNAELAVVYLVLVKFRQGEEYLKNYELCLHAIPLFLGLFAAILPLPYQAYNATGGWLCWVAESPLGCSEHPTVSCDRGANWRTLRFYTGYLPLFITQIIVALAMIMVYWTVYSAERAGDRYSGGRNRTQSRRVALRCTLYVLSFEITWFFALFTAVRDEILAGRDKENDLVADQDPFFYLNLLLLPTYGIWSSIAYFALPFFKNRADHKHDWSCCQTFMYTIWPQGNNTRRNWDRGVSTTRSPWSRLKSSRFISTRLSTAFRTPTIINESQQQSQQSQAQVSFDYDAAEAARMSDDDNTKGEEAFGGEEYEYEEEGDTNSREQAPGGTDDHHGNTAEIFSDEEDPAVLVLVQAQEGAGVLDEHDLTRRKTEVQSIIDEAKTTGVRPSLTVLREALALGIIEVPDDTGKSEAT
ncbi:expressed unknown protein [Seminavis robusta]|uniref:G-protein coupled receptors family 2 profile 2 domain-containing protein n=1 Tax=Seminavis robusta TaxID=568900 RepID=A0A9N8D7I5_9STRA|nr:expressed unknown protein [Seminavis robusta]|eukprot:Sro7_g005960.1 n/a (523) ;mRNA; r:103500-105068